MAESSSALRFDFFPPVVNRVSNDKCVHDHHIPIVNIVMGIVMAT